MDRDREDGDMTIEELRDILTKEITQIYESNGIKIDERMNKSNIPDNLTYEEFERLANRQPNLNGDFIYRLPQLLVDPDMLKNPYPKFEVDYKSSRLFMSFEAAHYFK